MAGLLAHTDITTNNVDTQIYVVPSNKTTTATIRITNRNAGNVKIRMSLSDTVSLNNTHFILYDYVIGPGETYTEPGVVLGQAQYIFVRSDTTAVSVVVWGFEEATS